MQEKRSFPAFLLVAAFAASSAASAAPAARPAAPAPAPATAATLAARVLAELDRPQALSDLYRLFERREEETDLVPIANALEAINAAPRARADVRALALELRAQIAVSQGQLAQARALSNAVAPVRAWALIGPFDNEGRSGLITPYGPEKDGYVPERTYPGKEHDVSWRALPELAPLGFIDLSGAIAPRQEVTVYAATTLTAARAQGAVLHLGASGATRIWINGVLVHEDKNEHPSRFDQRAIPVRLRAGDNAVLLKIAHGTGRLGFSLRLAGERDEPLPSLAAAASAPEGKPSRAFIPLASPEGARPKSLPALPRPLDALVELRAHAAKVPADARAQEDLAILLAWRRPDDEIERLPLHAQERAAAAAPGDPLIELRLSRLEDQDANQRRAALDRALEKHPDDAQVLDALAVYRLERGDGWKALELAQRARAAAPSSLEPELLEARALEAVGLTARAASLRLESAEKHPTDARAHRSASLALRRMGRSEEARNQLRRAIACRYDDGDARGELVGLLLDHGDLDGALRLVSEQVALDPATLQPRLRAAELLSQNGRAAEAERIYLEALALSPDDPELHEQLGRHRLRQADDSGALAAFARALSLRPQNPALRELVRTVRPEERYAAPYLYDAAALAKAPSPPGFADDVEVLADLGVTKVFANGLSSRTRQLIIRALSPRGVDQSRSQSVQFSPERQVVRVERARILRKDGSVLETKSESERSLSEPWYGLYYDVRAKLISFPQLQPGDTLELITRIDDAGSNFFSDYFGDFQYLQGTVEKRVADYVLLLPQGRTLYSSATPLAGLQHSETRLDGGGTAQRWMARDVPRIVPEPSMPGSSELFAYVHVSTYKDWESVGRFYWGLVKDQLKVTAEISKAAEEAVRGIPVAEERARIGAVYDFVVTRTRYVGLEFGINSFKPYPVETILNRRFGDCKDKASLMHAMLESLGIDSRLTLLRMKRMGTLTEQPASLAVFNHAILYVPKYDLFLDGTAEFHGSSELPDDDHGAQALIVEPSGKGSRFVRTPEAEPQQNSDVTQVRVGLRPDGSASLELEASAQGSWTAEMRRSFESPDERRTRAEEQLARGAFPNVKVTRVEVSDPHDIEKPFKTRFSASAPGFATPVHIGAEQALRFSPFGQRQGFVESWAQLSKRMLPQRLPLAQHTVIESRVELPAGWTATLPEAADGKGPQGSWSVRYSREGGAVLARLELTLSGGLLQPKEYPAFRAFLGKLDEALSRRVEASPGNTTAALAPATAPLPAGLRSEEAR